jgi:hypothetical protein
MPIPPAELDRLRAQLAAEGRAYADMTFYLKAELAPQGPKQAQKLRDAVARLVAAAKKEGTLGVPIVSTLEPIFSLSGAPSALLRIAAAPDVERAERKAPRDAYIAPVKKRSIAAKGDDSAFVPLTPLKGARRTAKRRRSS